VGGLLALFKIGMLLKSIHQKKFLKLLALGQMLQEHHDKNEIVNTKI